MYFSHQMRAEYLQEMKEVYARKNKEIERLKRLRFTSKTMEELHLFEKQEGRKGFDGFENTAGQYVHPQEHQRHLQVVFRSPQKVCPD